MEFSTFQKGGHGEMPFPFFVSIIFKNLSPNKYMPLCSTGIWLVGLMESLYFQNLKVSPKVMWYLVDYKHNFREWLKCQAKMIPLIHKLLWNSHLTSPLAYSWQTTTGKSKRILALCTRHTLNYIFSIPNSN